MQTHRCFYLETKEASSLHLAIDPVKSLLFCPTPWGLAEPF
jgi:hypothetical protein